MLPTANISPVLLNLAAEIRASVPNLILFSTNIGNLSISSSGGGICPVNRFSFILGVIIY